jgi:glycosyltransferase involved in cell wall biosynthesis
MWPTEADPSFGVFVDEQVTSLRERGVDVSVEVIEGTASRLNYLTAVGRLRRRIRTEAFDLVHSHYCLTAAATWLARAGLHRPPLVVTHHGVEVFTGWQAHLARWTTARADRTLVISRAMAAHLGLDADAVLPCGVNLRMFKPAQIQTARERIGKPLDSTIVAWVGADRPEKRLSLARAAVADLAKRLPEVELLVVSESRHDQVPHFLQAANVLLITSASEGGPLVAKEALACDLPVVSTDVGDVRDLVGDVAGCAVTDGTVPALAAALATAIAHGAVNGRSRVAEYSLERVAERLETVYARVIRDFDSAQVG